MFLFLSDRHVTRSKLLQLLPNKRESRNHLSHTNHPKHISIQHLHIVSKFIDISENLCFFTSSHIPILYTHSLYIISIPNCIFSAALARSADKSPSKREARARRWSRHETAAAEYSPGGLNNGTP